MAKSILISIKPRYVADILNHKKTIEVRKSMPKCELPIEVYIYCTRGNGIKDFITMYKHDLATDEIGGCYINGTVIAKFTLNKVEEIRDCLSNNLLKKSCLNGYELADYLNFEIGYAWHIDDLVIFDRPRELREFNGTHLFEGVHYSYVITKAPQSWCYIESKE